MIKISNERKSQIFYHGNGTQTQYQFPFDYLRRAFVKVQLISSDSTTDLTQGTDYNVSDRVVTLTNPTSLKIQIYRETTTKPLVGWADASVLRAADMTVQSTQLLHLSEETMDKVQDGGLAKDTNDGVWDARYNRIKNLLDPKEPGDAVTLSYIVANQTSLINALKATGKEQNDSIVSTGNTQNTRLTTTGDTQNKRLTDTGDSYVSTMTTLKNTATTKATEASDSAELSKKWAMSSSSPDGVAGNKSSKTWAEEAKSSASASATSASNSATSATASATSATKAATSEANAKSSETNAKASETAAKSSQTSAKTSETNAAASAKAAAQSEANAKVWDPTQYVTKVAANQLLRNKSYAVGDIAYSPNLPSYAYLECTTAGTTGASEPDFSSIKSGVVILDGYAKFTIKTVCAKEYVDALTQDIKNRIRIESGTIELGEILKENGYSQYIAFKEPVKNTNYSVVISIAGNAAYWADLATIISSQSSNGFFVNWWNKAPEHIPAGLRINWLAVFYDD